jgi:hypothetical protein
VGLFSKDIGTIDDLLLYGLKDIVARILAIGVTADIAMSLRHGSG